jgi:hypothetical protein
LWPDPPARVDERATITAFLLRQAIDGAVGQ